MTTTDIIQIIAIAIGTFTSITAIVISILTLKQTNKITKEANRPYVCATLDYIAITPIKEIYLVIKNYGTTGATINNISFSNTPDFLLGMDIFNNLAGSFIAPGQSLSTTGKFESFKDFTVKIDYSTGKDKYSEVFHLSPKAVANMIYTNTNDLSTKDLAVAITNTTRGLIRNNF